MYEFSTTYLIAYLLTYLLTYYLMKRCGLVCTEHFGVVFVVVFVQFVEVQTTLRECPERLMKAAVP